MSHTTKSRPKPAAEQADWKARHERQKLLIESIMSLLAKYGNTLDLKLLYREYLLTIMGHFLSGDSCYYAKNEIQGNYAPILVYGKIDASGLPCFSYDCPLVDYLERNPYPCRVSTLPDILLGGERAEMIKKSFELISPICLKDRLMGVTFLGKKISAQPYSSSELSLLHSLGVASAMSFNHASLLENTKLSIAELNKLNSIRNEIISRITHEFRTPLTVIKGGLAALKPTEKQAEVVKWIKDSVGRLEDLISSLLDLNESGFEDTIISLNDWDPASVLQEAVLFHNEIAKTRGISIEITEISPGSIPQLKITAERFRHVLNNLIDNAIKFSADSATISLGFEQILRGPDEEADGMRLPDWKEQFKHKIDEYSMVSEHELIDQLSILPPGLGKNGEVAVKWNQRFVVFKITDGGIGIPTGEIASVSEPFQQASNSPNRKVKGSGLGLSVAQRIISRRGGHIYCRSEEGRGTTFTVFLPLK